MEIRNFCIIAHIDHGKSTLADRLLEVTGTVQKREMKEQLLDQMDLERERGITIKLQPVRMAWKHNETPYILNLIDTPGHVDFSYEVSRSLAAVEGAVLLVDATQGIQAQTLANLYLAIEQDLTIIPVINKIDLPAADVDRVSAEIVSLVGCSKEDIIPVSAKTGENVEAILARVVESVPPPRLLEKEKSRSLIFDSVYDSYKGVIAYVRVFEGSIRKGDKIRFMATKREVEVIEVGYFKPRLQQADTLEEGSIGYVVTGIKDVGDCRVGDTIASLGVVDALDGYKEMKPMVFAGVFVKEGDDYAGLRDAIEKLKLTDASLVYEPEYSPALGHGFRCGFLGLLHLEIFQERLRREHNLDIMITVPSVVYEVTKTDGEVIKVNSPQGLPDPTHIQETKEPIVRIDIITPSDYVGGVMQIVQERRGEYKNTEYINENRAVLHYELPLASLLADFYDKLKTVSSGYASLNYEFSHYSPAHVAKMDILIAEEPVESLSMIVYRDSAHDVGKKIVTALKEVLPRQQFVLKIQAAIGGKIVAAERISAMRKDVTAKLYGGDVTRKRKLLEKQKKGKKKMMAQGKGKVDIPAEAYIKVLKR